MILNKWKGSLINMTTPLGGLKKLLWAPTSEPLPYSVPTVDLHDGQDAESDGNCGLEGGETRVKGLGKLVGDYVVRSPKDARTSYQRKDAADEEYRDGTLPPDWLKQRS